MSATNTAPTSSRDLAERREIERARVRRAAARKELRAAPSRQLADLVVVDAAGVLADAVLDAVKYLPVIETFQPWVRWPPAGRPRPITVSPGLRNAR